MPWGPCLEGNVATLACLPIVIKNVVNFALAFSGIVAIAIIIFGGAKYITSQGDQTKLEDAKKTITYAIIGLVVIFSAFLIVNIIGQITGVSQISNPTL